MANSVDPDQTAPIGAVCSGSTLFVSILNLSEMLGSYLQQATSADDIFLPIHIATPRLIDCTSAAVALSVWNVSIIGIYKADRENNTPNSNVETNTAASRTNHLRSRPILQKATHNSELLKNTCKSSADNFFKQYGSRSGTYSKTLKIRTLLLQLNLKNSNSAFSNYSLIINFEKNGFRE